MSHYTGSIFTAHLALVFDFIGILARKPCKIPLAKGENSSEIGLYVKGCPRILTNFHEWGERGRGGEGDKVAR